MSMSVKRHVLTIPITTSKKQRKKMKKQNPNGKAGTPFVTVLICNSEKADAAKSGDFTVFGRWARKGKGIEQEYYTSSTSKMQAYEDEDRIVRELRSLGWRVWNSNPSDRCVYIVRLRESVWKMKKFRKSNKGEIDDFVDFLYVGETGVKGGPEKRYKIHTRKKNGKMHKYASDVVHIHHKELALDLMDEFKDENYTRLQALRKEKEVAERLRKLGYATYFG